MKIAVGLLVVGVLVVGLAFADPNPPNYGHYYHYTYTFMNFFVRNYGTSGDGMVYYDYNQLRQKISLVDSERVSSATIFQFFDNKTQYTYYQMGNRSACGAQTLLYGFPNPDGSDCTYNGTGLVLTTKTSRWTCEPMMYANFLVDFDTWTDLSPQQTPVREVETYSTTDETPAGSVVFDISGFVEKEPNERVWQIPAQCFGKKPRDASPEELDILMNVPKRFF